MLELIKPFTDEDLKLLAGELETLFVFHDKPLTAEKKSIIVHELAGAQLPLQCLLQGIASLKLKEDLTAIKVSKIIVAARGFLAPLKFEGQCGAGCFNGLITMKDEQGYQFALACKCGRGEARIQQGLRPWSGEQQMMSRGRTLTRT